VKTSAKTFEWLPVNERHPIENLPKPVQEFVCLLWRRRHGIYKAVNVRESANRALLDWQSLRDKAVSRGICDVDAVKIILETIKPQITRLELEEAHMWAVEQLFGEKSMSTPDRILPGISGGAGAVLQRILPEWVDHESSPVLARSAISSVPAKPRRKFRLELE
jgi:hypothetical protein